VGLGSRSVACLLLVLAGFYGASDSAIFEHNKQRLRRTCRAVTEERSEDDICE